MKSSFSGRWFLLIIIFLLVSIISNPSSAQYGGGYGSGADEGSEGDTNSPYGAYGDDINSEECRGGQLGTKIGTVSVSCEDYGISDEFNEFCDGIGSDTLVLIGFKEDDSFSLAAIPESAYSEDSFSGEEGMDGEESGYSGTGYGGETSSYLNTKFIENGTDEMEGEGGEGNYGEGNYGEMDDFSGGSECERQQIPYGCFVKFDLSIDDLTDLKDELDGKKVQFHCVYSDEEKSEEIHFIGNEITIEFPNFKDISDFNIEVASDFRLPSEEEQAEIDAEREALEGEFGDEGEEHPWESEGKELKFDTLESLGNVSFEAHVSDEIQSMAEQFGEESDDEEEGESAASSDENDEKSEDGSKINPFNCQASINSKGDSLSFIQPILFVFMAYLILSLKRRSRKIQL